MPDDLPLIRRIDPDKNFLEKNPRKRGGESNWFITDPKELENHRNALLGEIDNIRDLNKKLENKDLPSVVKAKLIEKAVSKSNRPKKILSKSTCPIIGVMDLGELLLNATHEGLEKLKNKVKTAEGDELAQLTAIENLTEFSDNEKLCGLSIKSLTDKAKQGNGWVISLDLFDYQDDKLNVLVKENLTTMCQKLGIKLQNLSSVVDTGIFKAEIDEEYKISTILKHPAIKEMSYFPQYQLAPSSFSIDEKVTDFPKPESNIKYPIVAMIDSGIPDNHILLSPWVKKHIRYVAQQDSDYMHGSFVGGLLSVGNHILGDQVCPEKRDVMIVDVHVLPSIGTSFKEYELIACLDDAIPKIMKEFGVKVFNMSLGYEDESCSEQRFSKLAKYLDKIQDRYDIVFVLPSGNIKKYEHQRTWPPVGSSTTNERLRVPGDCIRAVTVGALAIDDKKTSIVRKNEPTSYSCSGPGPSHVIKPDVVHYSGNLAYIGDQPDTSKHGIRSTNHKSEIIFDSGTSFSTPLVSKILCTLNERLEGDPSSNLLRALLIHNSKIPKNLLKEDKILKYVGFGLPTHSENMLKCKKGEITLILEKEVTPGYHVEFPFYWPESLIKDGKCYGQLEVTLVAKSPLDRRYGAEYIRAELSVQIQRKFTKMDKKGKAITTWSSNEISEVFGTAEAKKVFESDLVKETFKWKPIKKYERDMSRGIEADEWKIKISSLTRDGFNFTKPIPFVVLITLKDPVGVAPVYKEVVESLKLNGILTSEIKLEPEVRAKIRA